MMKFIRNKKEVVMSDEDYLVGNKIVSYETEYETIFVLINSKGYPLQTLS